MHSILGQTTGTLTEAVDGRHWDSAEIRRRITRSTSVYAARGLKPGDRVLIHFGNRLEFFAELLAIWQLGGCAVPIDSRLTAFEVTTLRQFVGARFSVIDDGTDPAKVDTVPADCVINALTEGDVEDPPEPGVYPRLEDDALILFTSGSSGDPKGVVHTHTSLQARWKALTDALGLKAYERTLCVLPTHFGHGLICNCLFPWLSGCDLIIAPAFKTDSVMQLGSIIDKYCISFMSSVPVMWSIALKTASPPTKGSLRRIHVGSAPLSEDMWTGIQKWSGVREVFNAYGITETGSWIAGTTGNEVVPESGLIGRPWGVEFRILDTEWTRMDTNPEGHLDAGQTGMIWVRTDGLMSGYFNRTDLTKDAIHDGWFKTGDIGFLDDEGRLHLKGRRRDEINKGGMKVFPAEIDEVFAQSANVSDVCAFGFPDELRNEGVGVALVLEDTEKKTIQDLHHWISQRLAGHKHPERWYVLDDIPRTSRGKLNRETVMKECMERTPFDFRAALRAAGNQG